MPGTLSKNIAKFEWQATHTQMPSYLFLLFFVIPLFFYKSPTLFPLRYNIHIQESFHLSLSFSPVTPFYYRQISRVFFIFKLIYLFWNWVWHVCLNSLIILWSSIVHLFFFEIWASVKYDLEDEKDWESCDSILLWHLEH